VGNKRAITVLYLLFVAMWKLCGYQEGYYRVISPICSNVEVIWVTRVLLPCYIPYLW
jgi:hypothetical protein